MHTSLSPVVDYLKQISNISSINTSINTPVIISKKIDFKKGIVLHPTPTSAMIPAKKSLSKLTLIP